MLYEIWNIVRMKRRNRLVFWDLWSSYSNRKPSDLLPYFVYLLSLFPRRSFSSTFVIRVSNLHNFDDEDPDHEIRIQIRPRLVIFFWVADPLIFFASRNRSRIAQETLWRSFRFVTVSLMKWSVNFNYSGERNNAMNKWVLKHEKSLFLKLVFSWIVLLDS